MVDQTHPCVRATYSDVITTTRADHVDDLIVTPTVPFPPLDESPVPARLGTRHG